LHVETQSSRPSGIPGAGCNIDHYAFVLKKLAHTKYKAKLDFQTVHKIEGVTLDFEAAARNRMKEQPKTDVVEDYSNRPRVWSKNEATLHFREYLGNYQR